MTAQQAQEFLSEIKENPKVFRTVELYKCSFCLPVINGPGDIDVYRETVNDNWLNFTWKDKQFLLTCLDAAMSYMFALNWKWRHLEVYRAWENTYDILKEKLYGKDKPYNKVYNVFYDSYGTKNELAEMMQEVLKDKVNHDFCDCKVNFTWSDLTRRFMIGVLPKDVDDTDFFAVEEAIRYYVCTPMKKGEDLTIHYAKVDFSSHYSWLKRWRLGSRRIEADMCKLDWKMCKRNESV